MKGHRCRSGADLYRPAEFILKELYKEKEIHRLRKIKPEDQGVVESVWDSINAEGTKFMFTEIDESNSRLLAHQNGTPVPPRPEPKGPHRAMFNSDTDMVEDAVLFPEEFSSAAVNPIEVVTLEPIRKWETEGFTLANWVKGMDLVDSDDEENPSDLEEQDLTDDESSEESAFDSDEEGWSDIEENDEDEISGDPETFQKLLSIMAKTPDRKKGPATDPAGMQAEFFTYLGRSKARSTVILCCMETS